MATFFRRLANILRARQSDADLAEEMEHHRELKQRALELQGIPKPEAESLSRRALGNRTLAREDARAIWIAPSIDSIRQDVAYAMRSLRKNAGFSLALILVAALGIGTTTAVFGLLDVLMYKPLPVSAPERLVYLKDPSFSYPIFSEVRQRSGSIFSAFFAWTLETVNLDWGRGLEQSEILMASGDFYSSLGVDAAIGRTFTADDDTSGGGPGGMVAVISYDCWQRRFAGDSGVIGRTVQIDRRTFTIVGVTRKGFFGVAPGLAPEITIPLTTVQSAGSLAQVSTSWLHLMGRLRDGVSHEQANAAFRSIWPAVLEATTSRNQPADRRAKYLGRTTALEPGAQGFSRLRRSFGEPLRMLFALVGLLFAVACASTANLLLARGVARQREIAVRLAIGASRARIVRQLFTESLVASAIASSVGLLFALWTGNVLVAMMTSRSEPIAIELTPNWRIVLFALAATITTVMFVQFCRRCLRRGYRRLPH